jgi:XTP/dITP diphosphohydrolase
VAVELVSPGELGLRLDVEEDGSTYLENARKKARAAVDASGLPALADDSGLEVVALGGKPGVQSAYFAGREHYGDSKALCEALLRALGDRVREEPPANFRCTAVLLLPGGHEFVGEGVLAGSIAAPPRGDHGFGFDPIFRLSDGRHLAELSLEEKNLLSHRARALNALEVHGAFDAVMSAGAGA